MKHIIIGTAGHIDHGKTSLIRAITGRETDTLKEEKERGISINLGFTYFDLPSGKRAGIIDVPGHEKFVKNMLAGVSSIDAVLMVIAADEGIMPQTKEHFEILQLLSVKKGIIVLTKIDMVDNEWLSMIKEDIRNYFKDTFLQNAPIYEVSSKNGEGIQSLVNEIDRVTDEVEAKDTEGHFRLPVDRVFSISGFGTVVTGTVISGSISEGENVEVYPSKVICKVRGIQVHDNSVKIAEAGQRCALNLSGIKTSDVQRGDVISVKDLMEPSLMVDCRLYYLKSAGKPLENRQRVRLYNGTSEILCRVVILDKEDVKPGEEAYVQLRLEKPLTAQRNDRYVIRSYSPMYTIGGGIVIEPLPKKVKRFDENYIADLKIKESGETKDILEKTVENISNTYPNIIDIIKALGKNEETVEEKIETLREHGNILKLTGNLGDKPVFIHKNFMKEKINEIERQLSLYHKSNPLKWGMSKEEIKNKIFGKNLKQKYYDELLNILEGKNIIDIHNNFISLNDFKVNYSKEQIAIKEILINEYKKAKFTPPKYEDLINSEKDKKNLKMVYDSLIDEGALIKISEECVLLKEDYLWAKEHLIKEITEKGSITASEWRDILNTSRKYAVAMLEYFDGIKITKRVEDKRILA